MAEGSPKKPVLTLEVNTTEAMQKIEEFQAALDKAVRSAELLDRVVAKLKPPESPVLFAPAGSSKPLRFNTNEGMRAEADKLVSDALQDLRGKPDSAATLNPAILPVLRWAETTIARLDAGELGLKEDSRAALRYSTGRREEEVTMGELRAFVKALGGAA